MTIYEIKRRLEDSAPQFFSRETLKFFGQTMKDFRVYKQEDGRFLFTAPIRQRCIGLHEAIPILHSPWRPYGLSKSVYIDRISNKVHLK